MNSNEKVIVADKYICDNIDYISKDKRGLLSQNILANLRSFVEAVAFKAYCYSLNKEIEDTYENIQKANAYVHNVHTLNFVSKFHNLLQIVASHVVLDENNSERLMLKYYEYLLRIKLYLRNNFNLRVLNNLNKFPLELNLEFKDYYSKIAKKIDNANPSSDALFERYYVNKVKPFFINEEIYYEISLSPAKDYTSKFDRIVAFSKYEIQENYSIKAKLIGTKITMFNKEMPINIVCNWEVAIRGCELKNFSRIFGKEIIISTEGKAYKGLMNFIKQSGYNLLDLVTMSDSYYKRNMQFIFKETKSRRLYKLLNKCRNLIIEKSPGHNIIRYLLYTLNNKIIKQQLNNYSCDKLSNLFLNIKCKPFDDMPLVSSLVGHNPRGIDIYNCIELDDNKYQIPIRKIKTNLEVNGVLYTDEETLNCFADLNNDICKYNSNLYKTHTNRKIEEYNKNYFLSGDEESTFNIIEKLKELTKDGIANYQKSFLAWIENGYVIDSEEKLNYLKSMFNNSKVALIYGAAGTGKSTLIKHISNFFANQNKLFLTNTNPAINNLKRNIGAPNSTFSTITSCLKKYGGLITDILIIDECSTVSNLDMMSILNNIQFKLIILVGDIYQIESITFGNWFKMAKYFIPKESIYELSHPYRTDDQKLLTFWNKVRNIDEDITEHIARSGYSTLLNETIFQRLEENEDDEIVLCLNYDGLYGINNINRFLQANNTNAEFTWGIGTYRIGDPILFNENNRFSPVLYNNLKGKIIDIKIEHNRIRFDIELDIVLNELEVAGLDLELIENVKENKSTVRFYVDKYRNSDEDDEFNSSDIIPFQIAYAISIHKAQGLEYNSVKIVISNEVEELITHNIFYTAITRSKKHLKIYWSAESQTRIIKSFKDGLKNKKDISIFGSKFRLKVNRF